MSRSTSAQKIEWGHVLNKLGRHVDLTAESTEVGQGENQRTKTKHNSRLLIPETSPPPKHTNEKLRGLELANGASECDQESSVHGDSDIDSILSSEDDQVEAGKRQTQFTYKRSQLKKNEFLIKAEPAKVKTRRYQDLGEAEATIPKDIPKGHIVDRIDFDRVLKVLPKTDSFRVAPVRERIFTAPKTKGFLAELGNVASRESGKQV